MANSHSTPSSITPTEKGLLARIRVASTALSRAERQVAEFLLQKPHDALEMSIRVLAQACDVSEPTVARFSQSLGFDGFKSFKLAFAKSLATGIPYLHLDVNQADHVRDVLPKVFDRTIAALMEARNNANVTSFEAAVQLLARARRIECYGLGYSGALAIDAQLKFFRFGIPTTVFCDAHLQAQSATLLNSDCVVVAFSRTGRTRDLINSVQLAKQAGAKFWSVRQWWPAGRAGRCAHQRGRGRRPGYLYADDIPPRPSDLYRCAGGGCHFTARPRCDRYAGTGQSQHQ
jgi:RpiR family carbohydrate utilization transcriptional regulator